MTYPPELSDLPTSTRPYAPQAAAYDVCQLFPTLRVPGGGHKRLDPEYVPCDFSWYYPETVRAVSFRDAVSASWNHHKSVTPAFFVVWELDRPPSIPRPHIPGESEFRGVTRWSPDVAVIYTGEAIYQLDRKILDHVRMIGDD